MSAGARDVTSSPEPSVIQVRPGILDQMGSGVAAVSSPTGRGGVVIVTDETVGGLYADRVCASFVNQLAVSSVYRIPPGEGSKSLAQLSVIYDFFAAHRIARDGLIVALGGGVVSDLAGFAAATWMRGIPWVALPTTLEAQIDAGIGGKTAINIRGGKNLVGAFHRPRAVLIDPTCLRTLDPRDIRAGLAESIKHALITSEGFFAWHEQHVDAILALDEVTLVELIERNVRIKTAIVERDPFEQTGDRMTLNFGHTIGHAIEACADDYALRHGECVAMGMLAACRLSNAMGLLDRGVVDRLRSLLERFGLPTRLEQAIAFDRIMDAITRDKKARGKQVQWVLLEAIGQTHMSTEVDERAVREAYESLIHPT